MILDFFYETLKEKKLRQHFNEFMIKFHNFIHENKKNGKDNGLEKFVKNLSNKTKIIYSMKMRRLKRLLYRIEFLFLLNNI